LTPGRGCVTVIILSLSTVEFVLSSRDSPSQKTILQELLSLNLQLPAAIQLQVSEVFTADSGQGATGRWSELSFSAFSMVTTSYSVEASYSITELSVTGMKADTRSDKIKVKILIMIRNYVTVFDDVF